VNTEGSQGSTSDEEEEDENDAEENAEEEEEEEEARAAENQLKNLDKVRTASFLLSKSSSTFPSDAAVSSRCDSSATALAVHGGFGCARKRPCTFARAGEEANSAAGDSGS
jgi:hypothetical protein